MPKLTDDLIAMAASEPMEYVKHDVRSSEDIKCRRLLARRGYEGYGMWWRLVELMGQETGHVLDLSSDEDLGIRADQMHLAPGELSSLLDELADIGLIVPDLWREARKAASSRLARDAYVLGRSKASGRCGGRPPKR